MEKQKIATSQTCDKMLVRDPNDFRIEPVKEKDMQLYIKLYRENFVTREPLGLGLHLDEDELMVFVSEMLNEWISSGASVCAIYIPTNEVVGAMFTKILSRKNKETFVAEDISHYSEGIQSLIKILNYLENSLNLFEDENVEKVLEIGATTVSPKFAGNRLVYRLTEESEKLARELGCQMATSQSTNKITKHIRMKLGYEACFEVDYKDIKIENVKSLDVAAMNGTTGACVFKKYLK